MKDHFILACREYFVKQRGNRRKQRQIRKTLHAENIAPHLKALGKAIARSERERRPFHVPALSGAEWGQVLRTLELTRAYT